jgi:hypothetical protein
VVSILILVMIGSLVSSQVPARFSEAVGTDFVQLWGAAVARRLCAAPLGSPHADGRRYHEVVTAYAAEVDQSRRTLAIGYRGGPEPHHHNSPGRSPSGVNRTVESTNPSCRSSELALLPDGW